MRNSTIISLTALPLLLQQLAAAQSVFINQVQPAYRNLDFCAELPLSTLVRDMVSGCGDGGRTTSYSCFCSENSAFFERVISTEVVSHCTANPGLEAMSALEVFHSYCDLDAAQSTETSDIPPTKKTMAGVLTTNAMHNYTEATRTEVGPSPTSASTKHAPLGWGLLSGLLVSFI